MKKHRSLKQINRVALTELQTLFYSPIAWFILVIFTFQCAMTFSNSFGSMVQTKELGYSLSGITVRLFLDSWRGFYTSIQSYLYLYIPLLTMGIMSREIASGSIKLLYSSPIKNQQIIFGKYLSIVAYALIMTAILFLFVLYGAAFVVKFDFWAACSGLLGVFLLICAYGAIGLFMSSLTSYQVIAAIGTLAILGGLNYVDKLWQDIAFVREITYWLSINGRAETFFGGMICSEDVLYFLTVIALFLALSILRMKSLRQKTPWHISIVRYLIAVCGAVVIGYFSSRPQLMCYLDTTRTKICTLTKNSQDIVSQLKGGLTITTYSNILDESRFVWHGTPRAELDDRKRIEQFLRFKPEIKMKYVRYYAKGNNEAQLNQAFPTLDDKQRMAKIARNFGVDSTLYYDINETPELKKELAPEGFRYVKGLERSDGQKTFLRVFNDMQLFPSETEISAAFKRLVMELPKVAFVEGHEERSSINDRARDYNVFASERTFRYSLINQGFDFEQINLSHPINDSIDIVVLAEPKSPLTEAESQHLDDYIAKGGNLIIGGDVNRQAVMNPIVARFGARFVEGRLVKPSDKIQSDLICSYSTPESGKMSYYFEDMYQNKRVATMPGAVAIDASGAEQTGYKATPMFVSDTLADTWSELQTTDYVDEIPTADVASGEIVGIYPTAVALEREINGKTQKILLLGDADCLSNGEISQSRKNINAANFSLITGIFHWMSDGEVPIDVRRPSMPDNDIRVTRLGMQVTKVIFMGVIPALLIFFGLFLWLRRRGR